MSCETTSLTKLITDVKLRKQDISVTDINYKRLGRKGVRKRTGGLRRVTRELQSLDNIDIRTFAEVATT